MQVVHAREGESVAGPNHQKRHGAGGRQRSPVAPELRRDESASNAAGRNSSAENFDRQASPSAAPKSSGPPSVGPLHPVERCQRRGAYPRGRRHVGGDQAGVREHRRQGGKQQRGKRARRAGRRSAGPIKTRPPRRSRRTAECPRAREPGCGRNARRGPECGSLHDTNRGRHASARRRGTAPTRP